MSDNLLSDIDTIRTTHLGALRLLAEVIVVDEKAAKNVLRERLLKVAQEAGMTL